MNIKQKLTKISFYKFKVLALAGLIGGMTACKDCNEPDSPQKPDEEHTQHINLADFKLRCPGEDNLYFITDGDSYKNIIMVDDPLHKSDAIINPITFDNLYISKDSAYFKAQNYWNFWLDLPTIENPDACWEICGIKNHPDSVNKYINISPNKLAGIAKAHLNKTTDDTHYINRVCNTISAMDSATVRNLWKYYPGKQGLESVAFKSIAQQTLQYSDIGLLTAFDNNRTPIARMPYAAIKDDSNKKPSVALEFKGIAYATIRNGSEKSFLTNQATLSITKDGTETIKIPCNKDTIKIIAANNTVSLKYPGFQEITLDVHVGKMPNDLRTRYSDNNQDIFTDISTDYYGESDNNPSEVVVQGIHNETFNGRRYIKYVFGGINQNQK